MSKTIGRRDFLRLSATSLIVAATSVFPSIALADGPKKIKSEQVLVSWWYSTKTNKKFQLEYAVKRYNHSLYHKNDDKVVETRMGYDPDGNYCLLKKFVRTWHIN